MPLSTRSLRELLEMFEGSGQSIVDTEGQRLRGVPGWELARCQVLSDDERKQWMEHIGYAGSYPAFCGDERVPVDIEEDDVQGRYRYRCPDTFRTKYVSDDLVAVYAVRAAELLNLLADLLEIPQAYRGGIKKPAMEGMLWNMGKMRVGGVSVDAWLVRGLSSAIDQVFEHFRTASLPDQGVIFSTGYALPNIIRPPRSYRIIPLASVLMDYTDKPCLDQEMIHRWLVAPEGCREERLPPVRFDPYTSTLLIATKSDQPWVIKGSKQLAVVRYLYEQFEQGRRWVPAYEILNEVYGHQARSGSRRIQNIFSGNTVWLNYIVNDKHGNYGFNLD